MLTQGYLLVFFFFIQRNKCILAKTGGHNKGQAFWYPCCHCHSLLYATTLKTYKHWYLLVVQVFVFTPIQWLVNTRVLRNISIMWSAYGGFRHLSFYEGANRDSLIDTTSVTDRQAGDDRRTGRWWQMGRGETDGQVMSLMTDGQAGDDIRTGRWWQTDRQVMEKWSPSVACFYRWHKNQQWRKKVNFKMDQPTEISV